MYMNFDRYDNIINPDLKKYYQGRKVLITGADGFVGINCIHMLRALGAKITVVSRRTASRCVDLVDHIIYGDLCDKKIAEEAVANQSLVFDFVGSTGAVQSNRELSDNIEQECKPHLNLFQACAESNADPVVLFLSSRLVYGTPKYLPVDETHATFPGSVYATHKLTVENYLKVLAHTKALKYTVFRVSNPYGPGIDTEYKSYGLINQFLDMATKNEQISLFGDGAQLRDYIYVDDLIVASLKSAMNRRCHQKTFNIGNRTPISIADAVDKIIIATGSQKKQKYVPWPPEYKIVETGDYYSDLSKIDEYIDLPEMTSFEEGIKRTLHFQYGKFIKDDDTLPSVHQEKRNGHSKSPFKGNVNALTDKIMKAVGANDSNGMLGTSLQGKRIIVTGANGFIGEHLVRRLIRQGAHVGALSLNDSKLKDVKDDRFQFLRCDLRDAKASTNAITTFCPEILFHLAANPDGAESMAQAHLAIEGNIVMSLNALEAFNKCDGKLFVYGDSTKVYGDCPRPYSSASKIRPLSSYAISKSSGWHFCKLFSKLYGMKVIAMRPTLIYGPRQAFNLVSFVIGCITNGKSQVNLMGGTQTRDPLYIDDAIDAMVATAERYDDIPNGQVINIGGNHEIMIKDLAELLVQISGAEIPVICNNDNARPTDMWRSSCDNREATNIINWEAKTSIEVGFRKTLDSFISVSKKGL